MKGIVCMWSGAIVDIPDGWALCDGNNGTPDLRGRFVLGAGGAFNPDDTGGSANHDHEFTPDSHYHTLTSGVDILQVTPGGDFSTNVQGVAQDGTVVTETAWQPYYALCYIIKM